MNGSSLEAVKTSFKKDNSSMPDTASRELSVATTGFSVHEGQSESELDSELTAKLSTFSNVSLLEANAENREQILNSIYKGERGIKKMISSSNDNLSDEEYVQVKASKINLLSSTDNDDSNNLNSNVSNTNMEQYQQQQQQQHEQHYPFAYCSPTDDDDEYIEPDEPVLKLAGPNDLEVPCPENVAKNCPTEMISKIAKNWKKDCRTWLWKNKSIKRSSFEHRSNLVEVEGSGAEAELNSNSSDNHA